MVMVVCVRSRYHGPQSTNSNDKHSAVVNKNSVNNNAVFDIVVIAVIVMAIIVIVRLAVLACHASFQLTRCDFVCTVI